MSDRIKALKNDRLLANAVDALSLAVLVFGASLTCSRVHCRRLCLWQFMAATSKQYCHQDYNC